MSAAAYAAESELAARWFRGGAGVRRVEDGRTLRVVFPGVPGGGAGPDARDAVLELGDGPLRGDVEFHLRASGWGAHGHAEDPAYGSVVLHVVAENDSGTVATRHGAGRAIAIAVASPRQASLPAFAPPCAREPSAEAVTATLAAFGERRLMAKAGTAALLARAAGPGAALYALALETLGGGANRRAFAALAERLPLPALLERAAGGPDRPLALSAALRGAAGGLPLVTAGCRPAASPARRLAAAGALVARLWPREEPVWPPALGAPADPRGTLGVPGVGASMAAELAVNAVLPVALGAAVWSREEALPVYRALPAPPVYGRLRPLEAWLGERTARPFAKAAALQGGLALHAGSCARGACGRCPLTAAPPP